MAPWIPFPPDELDEVSWLTKVLRIRAETKASMRNPRKSPYAAVARHEFEGGSPLVFGSADDCQVQLAGLAAHALRAQVSGDSFVCEAIDPGITFMVTNQSPEPKTQARFVGGGWINLGRYALRFSHQNFPAALVLDPESPRLKDGPDPLWFDPNPALRLEARLERDPAAPEETILSTRGQMRRAKRVGKLRFSIGAGEQQLTALRLLEPGNDESGFSIFFRDASTGRESYPVGRYIEPRLLGEDRFLLDFNRAYNPSCAFSTLFNCPIPPRENRLAVPILAGERDPNPGGDHP